MTRDLPQLLGETGLRVTRPRVAGARRGLRALPHADTKTILGAVRGGIPAVSHQAVDDSLPALTGAGLVRRSQPSGSVARDESRAGDNHHDVRPVRRDRRGHRLRRGRSPVLDRRRRRRSSIDEAEVVCCGPCLDCSTAPSTP